MDYKPTHTSEPKSLAIYTEPSGTCKHVHELIYTVAVVEQRTLKAVVEMSGERKKMYTHSREVGSV